MTKSFMDGKYEINDLYCIGTDDLNIILYEKRFKLDENKEPTDDFRLSVIGYYASFDALLDAMYLREVKKEFLGDIISIKQHLNNVCLNTIESLKNIKIKSGNKGGISYE